MLDVGFQIGDMRLLKKLFIILLIQNQTSGIVHGQLSESDTTRFQFRTSTSGSWQTGNVDLFIIRGKLDLVTNGKKNLVFKSQNNNLYQEFGGLKADNDISSRNYLYWKPQQAFYPFAMFYAQTNFRRKVDNRLFGGIGGTFQLLRQDKNNLKLSASIVREVTHFGTDQFNESFYNGNQSVVLWRATIYASGNHKVLDDKLIVFYRTYWQPAFEVVSNNRFQGDIGLEFPIWHGFSFLSEYTFSFEQVVADQVKQTDRVLTFGISYRHTKN